MLTAWCQAEITCDGEPCKAPIELRLNTGPALQIDTIEITKGRAVHGVKSLAWRQGWQLINDRWLCPYCNKED